MFKFFNFKNTDLYITFYGRPGLKYIANLNTRKEFYGNKPNRAFFDMPLNLIPNV